MKYHFITYGCQMNTADSAEMARPLEARGMIQTAALTEADVAIMNTCTVREHAEHKALSNLGRLKKWKAADPNRILIVAGCAASLWGEKLKKRYPYVDLVSPATRIEDFPRVVADVLAKRWNWKDETKHAFGDGGELRGVGAPERRGVEDKGMGASAHRSVGDALRTSSMPRRSDASTHAAAQSSNLFGSEGTAYITIMRGCNYTCSYCIVPQVRGRESYRPMPEILDDVRRHLEAGRKEVMLVGQTVNSYHYRPPVAEAGAEDRKDYDFADLLRAVNAVPGVDCLRFTSPHPRHMRERVIAAMAECRTVARHIHLPVQSGSDAILRAMKRLYTRQEYLGIVRRMREAIPGIRVTTDVIVGYPGETERDFADTVSLLEDVRFDWLFAFKYSPRPGTVSAQRTDDVPTPVKEERLQTVLDLNRAIAGEKAA